MNKVIISGRVVNNIEIFNEKVGKFTLAVQRDYKNQNGEYEADFLNCIVFNPTEYQTSNLLKGVKITVDGKIQTSTYDKGNEKHYSTDIIVNRIEYHSKPQNTPQEPKEAPINEFQDMKFTTKFDTEGQIEIKDSDLPF